MPGRRIRPRTRAGFTLVEAVVSTAITTIAGAALLLAISNTLLATDLALERTVAEGLAQQLIDEAAGARYAEPGLGAYQSALGPEAGELHDASREWFDDLDDFHGLAASPPTDPWGVPIGQEDGRGGLRHSNFRIPGSQFEHWRQEVEVFYVAEGDLARPLSGGETSDYRAIRARIYIDMPDRGPRQLAELTRVFVNVPH
jgi:type II secretory pathway pseudopilin PulG